MLHRQRTLKGRFTPITVILSLLSIPTLASAANGVEICLKSGCHDLSTVRGLEGYLQILEAKSPTAETDPDYPELSPKKREAIRKHEIDLVYAALNAPAGYSPSYFIYTIEELRRSLELRVADPYPHGVDIVELPTGLLRDFFRSPYIKGKKAAIAAPQVAHFRVDRPIESLNLKIGKRLTLPEGTDYAKLACKYDQKKDSYGTNPGFTVKCDGSKVKVKFGEIRSEPFSTRIMWALGYHVDPSDYAPLLRVAYDPKIFSEFNTHPGVKVGFRVAGATIFKKRVVAPGTDIFPFVDHAEMADGSKISGTAVTAALTNPSEESKIKVIAFKGVQIQLDDPKVIKVGPWSYEDFDHADNEDMRAVVTAMAWLGNPDIRRDNNRFALDLSGENPEWIFMMSDIGSVLGNATSRYALFNKNEHLEGFSNRIAKNNRLSRYRAYEPNAGFKRATRAEAGRVAARMLRLSESQIQDALETAGYSPTETAAYLRELLRRRAELAKAFL